jgi:hypothetical protein
MTETVHAPDREDMLTSAPLCGTEDPAAVRSFILSDANCKACLAIIDAQPGVLAWMIGSPRR